VIKLWRRKPENDYALYNDITEPVLVGITERIPARLLPRESWIKRFWRGLGRFFAAIIRMFNQLLLVTLFCVLVLLITRFVLHLLNLNLGDFSSWVELLSAPLLSPFMKVPQLANIIQPLTYNGYTIDTLTLVAIVAYTLGVRIITWIIRVPRKPKRNKMQMRPSLQHLRKNYPHPYTSR
jgi:hypothetical protein